MKPRPFFFAHVIGIRAYMLGRSIVMKAVGMWHWEVRQTPGDQKCLSSMHAPMHAIAVVSCSFRDLFKWQSIANTRQGYIMSEGAVSDRA